MPLRALGRRRLLIGYHGCTCERQVGLLMSGLLAPVLGVVSRHSLPKQLDAIAVGLPACAIPTWNYRSQT